jgi:hypothetical protein
MKNEYNEIKKILDKAGLVQQYEANPDFVDGFEISSNKTANNSTLSGEVISENKDSYYTAISFNIPHGPCNVNISTAKGMKDFLKAKQDMQNLYEQLQTDLKVMHELQSYIGHNNPGLIEEAKKLTKHKLK